ncbi:MAG TPA: archaeal proteasome endopeptidase complex subunit alpha [archaeon]|nr:archaeal proteasome endopeptidase complex subunit alpha [archaeon]
MVSTEIDNVNQMGYDQAIVVFSPEGRMYQVEYARKAVERSPTLVGVVFQNGVVIAATKTLRKLIVPESIEKVSKVDSHIIAASCGILSDSRVLLDYARVRSQVNMITYDQPIEVTTLVKDISDRLQKFTQVGGMRPFGVSLLIAGQEEDSYHLFETDPSGAFREWRAQAIGRGSKKAKKYLVANYKKKMTKEQALTLALKSLKEAEEELSQETVEIGVIEDGKISINTSDLLQSIKK